jgi:peptidoglycan/xylan/chitin deacetylase (PgdA/CDA1 family)
VLTYDDGPGRRVTPKVLDALGERRARATFFPLGSRAARAPEVLDRAAADGHELGCHGYAHVNALEATRGEAERDIELGYRALAAWVESRALFRPPYGKLSAGSWLALRRRGAPLGMWTVDSGDALREPPRIESVVAALERAGGGVVLMHDFDRDPPEPAREGFVLDLTAVLLELADERGWRVSTLSDVPA